MSVCVCWIKCRLLTSYHISPIFSCTGCFYAKKNNIELKPRNIPGMPSMAGFNPGSSDGGDTSGDDSTSIIKTWQA